MWCGNSSPFQGTQLKDHISQIAPTETAACDTRTRAGTCHWGHHLWWLPLQGNTPLQDGPELQGRQPTLMISPDANMANKAASVSTRRAKVWFQGRHRLDPQTTGRALPPLEPQGSLWRATLREGGSSALVGPKSFLWSHGILSRNHNSDQELLGKCSQLQKHKIIWLGTDPGTLLLKRNLPLASKRAGKSPSYLSLALDKDDEKTTLKAAAN